VMYLVLPVNVYLEPKVILLFYQH